jgi:ParB family chromosome partitioning protein
MNKRGLGRGLEALIPDAGSNDADAGDRILQLSIDSITANPDQPRREFTESELASLAASIRESGVLQPIIVREVGLDRFQLVAGERRLRAASRAGLDRIPAVVRETRDDQMLPLALVENLVRENLNPVEEARAYSALAERFSWSHEGIGERVGKSRGHVANTVRLLGLPSEILEDVSSGDLSAGHARALLACESPAAMFELRDAILDQGLSVREAEARTRPEPAEPTTERRRKGKTTVRSVSPEQRDLEERLQRIFGTPVQIHDKKGRGRVSMEFYSHDDLTRLVDLLVVSENGSPFSR